MSDVREQLALDDELLERCVRGDGAARFRIWTTAHTAVVLGLSQSPEREVFHEECARLGIEIVKRRSGGGAVVIGEGTLQYAFVLPQEHSPELSSIEGTKRYCNGLLRAALDRPGLEEDASGDLLLFGKKVGGIALRRRRGATLLHGTLITGMPIERIATLLRHPTREPRYREGRAHRDFLADLGPVHGPRLEQRVQALLTVGG